MLAILPRIMRYLPPPRASVATVASLYGVMYPPPPLLIFSICIFFSHKYYYSFLFSKKISSEIANTYTEQGKYSIHTIINKARIRVVSVMIFRQRVAALLLLAFDASSHIACLSRRGHIQRSLCAQR